jgi:hypothetical protein
MQCVNKRMSKTFLFGSHLSRHRWLTYRVSGDLSGKAARKREEPFLAVLWLDDRAGAIFVRASNCQASLDVAKVGDRKAGVYRAFDRHGFEDVAEGFKCDVLHAGFPPVESCCIVNLCALSCL